MKKRSKIFILGGAMFISCLTGFTVTSCNNGGDDVIEQKITVESVSLSSSSDYLEVGGTLSLTVKVLPTDATNKAVAYSSSDESVATVSNDGVVTGIKEGSVLITVKTDDGDKQSSYSLKVVKKGYTLVNVNEMGDELCSSYYKNNVEGSDKFGLSAADQVGVDKEEEATVLYAPESDSKFDKIIDASSLTLDDIKEVIPEATIVNDYYQIQASIYLAKKNGELGKSTKIKLKSGVLDIDTSNISTAKTFILDCLKNVAIEGNNTVINLVIDKLNYKGYMSITNCSNLTIFGITFRSKIQANVTGVVQSYDSENKSIKVVINSEYTETISRVIANNKSLRSYLEFHKSTKAPIQNGNFIVDGFSSVKYEKDGDHYVATIVTQNSIKESQIGTLASLQFAQYDNSGIVVNDSSDVYIESITMNNAYGMGMVCERTTNFYVNKFNLVVEEGKNDLMTSCADAMHFVSLNGDAKVTNSIIEYSHDDALNIKHGYWYKLSDASTRDYTMTLEKITTEMSLPKNGDQISVYNEETFTGFGIYTVESAKLENSKMIIKVKERIRNYTTWGNCRVTFLSDTPSFVFKNNIVRNKRNRGILIQVPNAIVENNTFMRVGHGSIQAATALDKFNEATLPQNITIRNNKFIENNYLSDGTLLGDISVFAIGNTAMVGPSKTITGVKIENNFFSNNGNACISLRGVGDSVVKDCLFYDVSTSQPSGEGYNCIFSLNNVSDLKIEGCFNQNNLSSTLSGIIPLGTTSADTITLIDNKDIGFQVIDDVGAEVDIKKATSSIKIDGDIQDMIDANATDIEIKGYTDAYGTEWTKNQLVDTFKINKLIMTYDDTGIYLGFDIYDNELNFKTINDFWLGDCVEVMASTITDKPNADLMVYKEDGGVFQAAFTPAWQSSNYSIITSVRSNSKYLENSSLLEACLVTTDSGYKGEIKFPFTLFSEFKNSIDEGKRIDMSITIGDCERTSRKRIQASNVPHNVERNKTSTARMPQYLFK